MIMSSGENMTSFFVGNVIAFVIAILAIKLFIGLIEKFGFRIWGWYRIVAGFVLIAYFLI